MNGTETLAAIREDGALQRLPVVVMTSSERDANIVTSDDLWANCYVRKRIDLGEFHEIVQSIASFWLGVVSFPPPPA